MVIKKCGYEAEKVVIYNLYTSLKVSKRHHKYDMQRPICSACKTNDCAINYKKDDKIYYRSQCDSCLFKLKKKKTQWMKDGYKKKIKCESCEFIPKAHNQLTVVVYNEGYRTVCLNCSVLIPSQNLTVKKGDLKADF